MWISSAGLACVRPRSSRIAGRDPPCISTVRRRNPDRTPASRQESGPDSFDAQSRQPVRDLTDDRSAVGARLVRLGLSLRDSPPFLSRSKLLIFLCGASVAEQPSPRRQAVQRFIHSLSTSHTVLYAEGIFSELVRHGHKKNILDLEHEISEIADKVLIILESESAFCELGAFAHANLRQKLLIVNSSHFRASTSFINQGPVAAAIEAKASVFWYPMVNSPDKTLDGIGAIYPALKATLAHRTPLGERVQFDKLAKLGMNKHSLYFAHDLVLISGPIAYEELVAILKKLFPLEKSFDSLKNLLGVLRESGLVSSTKIRGRWIV